MMAGISAFLPTASEASFLTQVEVDEAFDHSTTTTRASASASSITSSYWRPGGMVRSHQTLQPRASSARATMPARSRSLLE